MVPLRFASEYLGANVTWDEKNRTIGVSTNPNEKNQVQNIVSNAPIDKEGNNIQAGDRVTYAFFYGQVEQINGGRILVFWDSKSIFVDDNNVDYMATLAGIRYKSSSWINANEVHLEQ